MVRELTLKLYFNEDADPDIAKALGASGHDVLTAREAELLEASDDVQLAFAAAQGRALVSHNVKHYPGLHVEYLRQGKEHSGIILCQHRDVGTLQRWLKIFLNRYTVEDMRNQMLFLGKWIEAD